jgi:hypothetical protein
MGQVGVIMKDTINTFYNLFDLNEVVKQTGLSKSRISIAKTGVRPSKHYPKGVLPKLVEGIHWISGETKRKDGKGEKKAIMYTQEGIDFLKHHRKSGRKKVLETVLLRSRDNFKRMSGYSPEVFNKEKRWFSSKEVQNLFGISQATLLNYRRGEKRRGGFVLPLLVVDDHWMYHKEKLEGSFIRYSQKAIQVIQDHLVLVAHKRGRG